jgi:hypothetical protein
VKVYFERFPILGFDFDSGPNEEACFFHLPYHSPMPFRDVDSWSAFSVVLFVKLVNVWQLCKRRKMIVVGESYQRAFLVMHFATRA